MNTEERREYMRRFRERNPGYADEQRRAARARIKAMRKLARLHPDEFRILQNAERSIEGLKPIEFVRRGRRPETVRRDHG